MKDNYGDKISVSPATYPSGRVVYLAVTSHHDDEPTDAALTPAKARKLAQKLEMAAAVADGTTARDVGGYWLTLTEDQAKTLAVILGRVGGTAGMLSGQPVTARKYADEIRAQLENHGLVGGDIEDTDPRFTVEPARNMYEGSVYFIGVAE